MHADTEPLKHKVNKTWPLFSRGSLWGKTHMNRHVKYIYKTCMFSSLWATGDKTWGWAGVGDQHTKPRPRPPIMNQTPRSFNGGIRITLYSHRCMMGETQCPSLALGGTEKENMSLLRPLDILVLVLNGSRNQPVQVAHSTQSQCFIF